MELVNTFIFTFIVVLLLRWYLQRRRIVKLLEGIPGPPPLLLLGNALDFKSPKDILPRHQEYTEKYGRLVQMWFGPFQASLLISDYKFIEFLLTSTKIVNKSAEYQFLSRWLGTGLLISDGDEKWKMHRKMITPAFHMKILEQFMEVFESNSNILVKKLRKKVEKPSIDICPYITACTLDIICETTMGTSIKAQEQPESEYVRSVKSMCRIIMDRTYSPILRLELLYPFSPQYWAEKRSLKVLLDYTNFVINSRKLKIASKETCNSPEDGVGVKKKLTFLDLLLREKENNQMLSDQDIREEVNTFMFAGHDTTSVAVSFSLFCLTENQEVQENVVEELRTIFSEDSTRSVTLRDLNEMKYLEAVIKEVLRLYPPVPIYARNVHEETPYYGGTLPKGITLFISAFNMHRNPELYPEPNEFRPERFFSENTATGLPYSYIPFSAGSRNCIGQKFAMLEMKVILSTLLRNYKLLPTNPKHVLELSSETVLKSENGICIRLAERNF